VLDAQVQGALHAVFQDAMGVVKGEEVGRQEEEVAQPFAEEEAQ
jgi:hypothetical protein